MLEAIMNWRRADGLFDHEGGESDEMKAGEGFGVALVVLDEPTEAGDPSEGALDHPAPWQKDEAAFGLG